MNCSMPECTMAVKSVKPEDMREICRFISANTEGLLQTQDATDRIPEFPSAKIIYANYVSPQHARRAVELILVECTRRGWGGGRTRAATKDKLSSIKRSPENLSQLFPVYVAGLPSGNKQQQQLELQQLYSQYGSCWVAVNTNNSHAFINFDNFDSAMAAQNDSRGIRYSGLILRAKTAFETSWTHLVWTELKKSNKLSFAVLFKMAEAGVREESAKPFNPRCALAPLRCVAQFRVSDAEQQVTWARSADDVEQERSHSQEVAYAPPSAWSPQPSHARPAWSQSPSRSPSPKLGPQEDADRPESGAGDEASGFTSSCGLEETECGTPSKYECPIGLHLMQDPVRLSNGKVYERCEIEKYLAQGNNVCPLTQVRIDPHCVIPDPALQTEIARYARSQPTNIQNPKSGAPSHQLEAASYLEMEQALLGLKFGSARDNGERSGGPSSADSRAVSDVKPEQHSTAHPEAQALAGSSRQGTRLSDATVAEVSLLFRRLGGHLASAAQVVEENEVGGEDLKDFLEDEGREHNPLYMSVGKGGLGLGEIQVRKLRRELQKLFAEE